MSPVSGAYAVCHLLVSAGKVTVADCCAWHSVMVSTELSELLEFCTS